MRKHAIPRHFLVAAAYGLLALLMLTPASHARGAGAQASGPVSYADAVEKAAPAVVNVNASRVLQRQAAPFFDAPRPYRYQGAPRGRDSSRLHEDNQGSGVIVDARGYIVTNSHLVNGADRIEVVLHTGERLQAEIAGSDPDSDIAVLQVDLSERSVKLEPLPVITLGASSGLRVGDVVLAIGNPFGVGQTVTMGIVSATGRSHLGLGKLENFIQTDAAINPGNSGGALIDAHGALIAINSAMFSRSGGSQGIGFAIPADMVRGVMQQLLDSGQVSHGWLGIGGRNLTAVLADAYGLKADLGGVLITQVNKRGAASAAGLRPGDVISHIDEAVINSSFDVVNTVTSKAVGSEIRIRGWRGSTPLDLTVTLRQRITTHPEPPE